MKKQMRMKSLLFGMCISMFGAMTYASAQEIEILEMGYVSEKHHASPAAMTVEEKVAQLVSECTAAGAETEYEKALWFHNWLINHADYDETYSVYDASGVLLYGMGVCQSYTDAYSLLLNAVGIENMAIVSEEMNHTWNIVKINDSWTHIDVTWDDPTGDGVEGRNYFGLGDSSMAIDHTWEGDYPKCYDIVHDEVIKLPDPHPLFKVPLAGIDYQFLNASGKHLTRKDFPEGNTLLVYGRPICSNTMGFINSIKYLKDKLAENGVNVIVVFENRQQVAEAASTIPFTCVYEADFGYSGIEFMEAAGLSGGYVFPLVVLQDACGYVHYCSTGYVTDPEKMVATAIQKLPDTGKTLPYSKLYLYENEAQMISCLVEGMKNRLPKIQLCNPNSSDLNTTMLNRALNYFEEQSEKYGAFLNSYQWYGSNMSFELTYTSSAPETEKTPEIDKVPETEKTPEIDKVPETEKTPETDKVPETEKTPETDKTQETEKIESVAKPSSELVKLKKSKSTSKFAVLDLRDGEKVTSWKSSNKKLFTVKGKADGTCKITAKKKTGTGTLTIKLSGGEQIKVKVKVVADPTAIKSVPKKKTMKKGTSFTIKPKLSPAGAEAKITFTSSKPKVVSVSSKGKVKAKKKGTATITVKAGKLKKTCKITVK